MARRILPTIRPRKRGLSDTLEVEETVDTLFGGQLQLTQHSSGYRFGIDSLLLAATASEAEGAQVVDLGTGCGVVALALVHWYRPARVLAVELQSQLVHLALRNVDHNDAGHIVEVVSGDLRNVRSLRHEMPPQTFDVAVANPPYYPVDEGRLNPDPEKAVARHELEGALGDFVAAAAYALTHRGVLHMIYPADRLPVLLTAMEMGGLRPERLQFVHPRSAEPASLVLVAARRQGARTLTIAPPIVIHEGDGYTAEIATLLEGARPQRPGRPARESST